MNGAYQIINFDDIEFTTGTAELVVGAYKKITDTAKRFVITHLNLDDEVYKDIQLTFENVEGTFVGTGVVNGKLAVVSIASTDQVTVSLNDIAGGITALQNALAVTDAKFNYSTTEQVVGTWIDGRPVYRQMLTGTLGKLKVGVNQVNVSLPNAEIIKIYGRILFTENDTGYIVIPYVYNVDNRFQGVGVYYSDNKLYICLSFESSDDVALYSNKEYKVWIEYTKSTDTPPTP